MWERFGRVAPIISTPNTHLDSHLFLMAIKTPTLVSGLLDSECVPTSCMFKAVYITVLRISLPNLDDFYVVQLGFFMDRKSPFLRHSVSVLAVDKIPFPMKWSSLIILRSLLLSGTLSSYICGRVLRRTISQGNPSWINSFWSIKQAVL